MPPVPNARDHDPGASDDRGADGEAGGRLAITRLTFADLPQVLAIERRSYPAPWSLAMFVLETAKAGGLSIAGRAPTRTLSPPDLATPRPSGEVGERPDPDELVGYAIVSRYDDAYHLMNICTEPNRRREGIARELLEHAIAEAGGPDARITLEVRPSNEGARELYASLGFLAVGRRRRYYRDDGEDALIMWRTAATLDGRTDDIPGAEGPVPGRSARGVGSGGPVPPDAPLHGTRSAAR
ncbi:MAG: ribosomal protein S18-alanine N-acetyltransferase [Patulibacter sp.]|nr:ribosomal protein S18-alanine N-acetyltransferase [Patulibacter sp.]